MDESEIKNLNQPFPAVVLANINIPEQSLRDCLDESEIKDLHQPDLMLAAGKYFMADHMCHAEFL